MSRRHFSILAVIALILVAVVALLLPGKTARDISHSDTFLENLDERINDVDSLLVTPGQGTQPIHLDRNDQAWTIRELNGFPADWARLRELLAALAEAKVIEPKTSNPEYFSRLGVEDITDSGANSVLLQLGLSGEKIGVIIGNYSPSGRGQYVRMEGGDQAYLVDRELSIETDAIDWANKEIIDIGSALVAELQISHTNGDSVVIRKVSADDSDFSLSDIPDGRSIRSAWTVNSLANSFSLLDMQGVKPDTEMSFENSVEINLLSFSGLRISAEVFRQNEQAWIRIRASAPEANPEVQEQADAINQGVSAWIFQIPAMKYDQMTKRMEDLLEPLEQGETN